MKKALLAIMLFTGLGTMAQLPNGSFENWANKTAYFNGFNGFFHPDTFVYSDPIDWTSTNSLSGADTFGGKFLVSQSNNSHSGNSAIQLITDTLKPVGTPLGVRQLTIPGLALNGNFVLNLTTTIIAGGTLSPANVPGAGQPFTQRLANIHGYYNYTPVFNDSTNALDTCIVWAVLRKGTTEIASAIFKSAATTTGYQSFSAPFEYKSCDMPDTLVILMASSLPTFSSVLSGTTDLVRGSVLLVDDVDYDTLAASYNFAPWAFNDLDTTNENVTKEVMVKDNDQDCNDAVSGLSMTVSTAALHGTAMPMGTDHIMYTPAANYFGMDTFWYTLSDGTNTSAPARVIMKINEVVGIQETALLNVNVFPVPAQGLLNVQLNYAGKASLHIYDVLGNLVNTTSVNGTLTTVNTSTLANGSYLLQVTGEQGRVIGHSRFTVNQ